MGTLTAPAQVRELMGHLSYEGLLLAEHHCITRTMREHARAEAGRRRAPVDRPPPTLAVAAPVGAVAASFSTPERKPVLGQGAPSFSV